MNGGTFTPGVEKERAGMYFNFKSVAQERLSVGERGTVALPIPLAWGPTQQFVEINGEDDVLNKLGLQVSDPSLYLLREAMKLSKTVLLYRLNKGTKASIDLGTDQKATAKYEGTIGDQLRIRISENVVDASKNDVSTFLGVKQVDRQTVDLFEQLVSNDYVDFDGSGALTVTAGKTLTGGQDGEVTNEDVVKSFADGESEYFDTFAFIFDGDDDEQLKASFVSYIKRLRDQLGYKVQGIMANYAGDYEGIINVTNGIKLTNGRILTPDESVAWVAGAQAGATLTQSLTFVEYEGAIDAVPRFDNDETIERLRKGEFIFTYDPREKSVAVEKDINSFVSVEQEKNERFQKNRFIRVLDAINNDTKREIRNLIKQLKSNGSDISADEDGNQIVRTFLTVYLNTLQDGKAIRNFNPQNDINIMITGKGDGFNITLGVQPIDSAEKFYFGVEAR